MRNHRYFVKKISGFSVFKLRKCVCRLELVDFYKKQFGKNLKKILFQVNETQDWLAEQMGVQQSTVNRWVNGRDLPNDERAEAIAKCLGVSFLELVGLEAQEAAPRPPGLEWADLKKIVEDPENVPIKTWAILLEEFVDANLEIRARTLATLTGELRLSAYSSRSAKALKPPKNR